MVEVLFRGSSVGLEKLDGNEETKTSESVRDVVGLVS